MFRLPGGVVLRSKCSERRDRVRGRFLQWCWRERLRELPRWHFGRGLGIHDMQQLPGWLLLRHYGPLSRHRPVRGRKVRRDGRQRMLQLPRWGLRGKRRRKRLLILRGRQLLRRRRADGRHERMRSGEVFRGWFHLVH